jgi:predicted nucleic acid-binding protein
MGTEGQQVIAIRQVRLYVETSVWSYYFQQDVPERQAATRRFLDRLPTSNWEAFISEVVLREIEECDQPKRSLLLDLIQRAGPNFLEPTEEVAALAEAYLAAGAMPASKVDDAFHVAYATFYEMDALISWNQKHLANLSRRMKVLAVNMANGYSRGLEMLTAWEVQENAE